MPRTGLKLCVKVRHKLGTEVSEDIRTAVMTGVRTLCYIRGLKHRVKGGMKVRFSSPQESTDDQASHVPRREEFLEDTAEKSSHKGLPRSIRAVSQMRMPKDWESLTCISSMPFRR